ncbi:hypothetical protein EJ110_NYTH05851 [Nymphaea thermarum]|nr:hypothetical protein EJ110_NYTH05851 [Nymphaea thermarum]
MSRKVFLLFLHIFFLQPLASKSEHSTSLVSRIAFGSCSNQSAPQPIWDAIIKFDPQVFIWLGDNIYGDNRRPFSIFGSTRTIGPWKNAERFFPSSELEMRSRYHQAKSNPGYSAVRRKARVIGTWDDHDYGLNNAGKEFPGKDINQKLMLDFLDEPQNSPRCALSDLPRHTTWNPTRPLSHLRQTNRFRPAGTKTVVNRCHTGYATVLTHTGREVGGPRPRPPRPLAKNDPPLPRVASIAEVVSGTVAAGMRILLSLL